MDVGRLVRVPADQNGHTSGNTLLPPCRTQAEPALRALTYLILFER